jgi:acyl-CoA thioesterase I
MLAGMRAAPNLGPEYQASFDGIFPRLAKKHDLILYPFFLDGVAAQREMNQGDGLHPTAAGVKLIVERIMPSVEQFLTRLQRG